MIEGIFLNQGILEGLGSRYDRSGIADLLLRKAVLSIAWRLGGLLFRWPGDVNAGALTIRIGFWGLLIIVLVQYTPMYPKTLSDD